MTPEEQLLAQYLEGELEGSSLQQFEQQLQTDKTLAAKVRLMKRLDTVLADKETTAFERKLDRIGKDFFLPPSESPQTPPPANKRPWLFIALILLLSIIALLLWHFSSNTPDPDTLYAQYYKPYQLEETVRGDQATTNTAPALQLYRNGQFIESANAFSKILENEPNNLSVSFGFAHAQLQQSPPALESAAQQLQKILDQGNNVFIQDAAWYLALIQLKQGQLKEADKNLGTVIELGGSLATKANKLRADLSLN